jgi:hypothetical protein
MRGCGSGEMTPTRSANGHRFAYVLLAVVITLSSYPTLAENTSLADDKIQSCDINTKGRNAPGDCTSTEVYIVHLTVGHGEYNIPRNYIVSDYLDYPILRVSYPGFKPLNKEDNQCFGGRNPANDLPCFGIQLRIHEGIVPHSIMLHNLKLGPPVFESYSGEYGYMVFGIGPKDARTEYFSKPDQNILFRCISVSLDINHTACEDDVPLSDGNTIKYFFPRKYIEYIPDVETKIRLLFNKFLPNGG